MEEILKEIKNVPSVMGSYIHVNGVNKTNSDLPKIFQGKLQIFQTLWTFPRL